MIYILKPLGVQQFNSYINLIILEKFKIELN
jgi:hypothetical protein